MTSRTVNDGVAAQTWTYGFGAGGNANSALRTITAPDGTVTQTYFYKGRGIDIKYGFDDARVGMATEERVYNSSGTMLRRSLYQWAEDGPQSDGYATATRNPRVTRKVDIILDTGGNALAAATEMAYDADLNVISTKHYDYTSIDQTTARTADIPSIPNGTLLRTEETTFLVNDPYIDASIRAAYRARNLLSLPSSTRIRDGAGNIVAQGSIGYDESAYPILTYGSITGWTDPGTTVRGNATTVSKWLDTTNSYLSTHAQYDQAGNVRSAWDAKGNQSQISYSSAYAYAYPTQTTSAVPDANGAFGTNTPLVTSIGYDSNTGLVTSTTDANGKTTTFEYNDPLNRQTQVNFPDGGRTRNVYVDAHQCGAYVQTLTLLDSSGRETSSYSLFDALGRIYRTFVYDNQDPGNPFITVDKQYDAMGRAYRISSPYRSSGCTAGVNPSGRWTQTTFDALSRPKQVLTTADNAAVNTSYSGNTVTVTDQAGKKRTSVTDALGRLITIYEDPSGLNYQTNYTYDALGNLRKVDQGGQLRYFMYDSFSRLIRAKNPEQAAGSVASNMTDTLTGNTQWSMAYGYDNNGNLTARVDARNITTTYGYDALNRSTTVHYTDGTTKDIERHYDGAINGRGRFYYANWDPNNPARFDTVLAIDEYEAMGRPKNYRQHFLINGVLTPQFNTLRSYDYAGDVISQTYPSGHVVNYTYDIAGRMNTFSGTLGDGVTRTYSTGISYSEFGGLQQEQFGTATALYHKLHYNVRGQLYDIRLSTQSLQSNEFGWNRGCLAFYYSSNYSWGGNSSGSGADNNGNITLQQHWVPDDDAASSYSYTQDSYYYDALNRLSSTSALHGTQSTQSSTDYVQAYSYDRWGNRAINQSQTTANVPHPSFTADTGSNRMMGPAGYTLSYDNAGNQTFDNFADGSNSVNYTRAYDGENRMSSSTANYGNLVLTSTYTYDGEGRRIKRLVNGVETWQIYGIDGELLAEYKANAAAFLPAKEYGYRGGELLVTMSSGDDNRLSRFVTNLYYGALQRDPTSTELQNGINQLAAAGTGGYSQLLSSASQLARALFTSTNYEYNTGRTDLQYTTDLYYAYVQRGPDDGGLGWWVGQIPGSGRANVCNAFEASSEFQTLVSTLYGSATSDNQRTEDFVTKAYRGALGRDPNATELQTNRDALNAAAAQGVAAVQAQAETFVRSLVAAQVSDYSISDQQFVTNLYEAFLQRGPDAGGLGFWTSIAANGNRQSVLNAFATCSGARELAGTLYREAFWLVSDHLGTPRMIVDKSGSLASVKRHDYLPFGEELFAGTGGRTTAQGYSASDGVRQKFSQKERDNETGLDYFLARYYSSTQGRFTSPDEFKGGPEELYTFADDASNNPTFYANLGNPQSLNKYQYAYNNPLRYIDPDGHDPLDPPQNPACPCQPTPAQLEQMKKDIEKALDAVAGATGITALAEWLRENGPAAAKYFMDHAGKSAMQQDMEDLRMLRNSNNQSQSQQQQGQGQSNTASPNPDPNKKPIFGEKGTQTTSTTVGNGKGWRVDVENPNPGQRAGQIHYQSGDKKYLYDPNSKSFVGASRTENRRLLSDPQVQRAIKKGLKVLGEN